MLTASSLIEQLKNTTDHNADNIDQIIREYPRYNRKHERTDGIVEDQSFIAYSRKHHVRIENPAKSEADYPRG